MIRWGRYSAVNHVRRSVVIELQIEAKVLIPELPLKETERLS
eukprot:COSAG03_NODE_19436_length_336_cov_1.523207_1_plen_41_part_10